MIIESFGIPPGRRTLAGLRKVDEERIKRANNKVSVRSRKQRRKRRADKKSKGDANSPRVTYFPGAFDLSAEPEIDIDINVPTKITKKNTKTCTNRIEKKVSIDEPEIMLELEQGPLPIHFVDEATISVFICI